MGVARPLWRSAHPVCIEAEGSFPLALIDLVVLDAKFMDEFTVVGAGGKPQSGYPSPSPCSPAVVSVVTDGEGKRYPTPI